MGQKLEFLYISCYNAPCERRKEEVVTAVISKLRSFFLTKSYLIALLIVSCVITTFGLEVAGVIFFVLLISVQLFLCDDILVTTAPFLLLCTTVIKCYDSFDTFVKLAWLGIPLTAGLIYHFVRFRASPHIGVTFWGVVAVAVSITLGGLGIISTKDYFNPVSLFYVLSLGDVMVVLYLLLSGQMSFPREYSVPDYICRIMYTVVLLGIYMVFHAVISVLPTVLETGKLPRLQWSNNVSTLLIIALPFVYRFRNKTLLHLSVAFLALIAMFLSGSRGGWVMGTATYALSAIVFIIYRRHHRALSAVFFFVSLAALCAGVYEMRGYLLSQFVYDAELDKYVFLYSKEPRMRLFERMKNDFSANPLFGRGLGYSGNKDIYDPKKFAMHWYHSAPMQIIASLGITGIFAYCTQIATGLLALLRSVDSFKLCVLCSFTGLWLMSCVNPGIFCPYPYAFIMMMLLLITESPAAEPKNTDPRVIVISEE